MKHIPFDPDAPLVLRTEIDTSTDQAGPSVFAFRIFRIHLFLENRTDIPVERPLILFPRLGLDIRPYPPMTIQPAMSGPRKLLSCTASTPLQIAPRGSLKASAIMFSYDRSNGAFALTPNDSRRIGAAMSDCRIVCATGAANFPLRQAELLVTADALRTAIDTVFSPDGEEMPRPPLEQSHDTPLTVSA